MSVMRDDEQNAAAKSNIALSSLAQAKPHEARRRGIFALLLCLRLSLFFFEFASAQLASGITQIKVHFLGREAATELGNGQQQSGTAVGKTRGWRGWLQGENRLQSSGRGG